MKICERSQNLYWFPLSLCLISNALAADPVFFPKKGDFAAYHRFTDETGIYSIKNAIEWIEKRYGENIYHVASYRQGSVGDWVKDGTVSQYDPRMSNAYFSDVHAGCEALRGTIQTIDVPAGRYETCRVVEVIGGQFTVTTFYAASIPLGVVKNVVVKKSDPSRPITVELVSFGRAP